MTKKRGFFILWKEGLGTRYPLTRCLQKNCLLISPNLPLSPYQLLLANFIPFQHDQFPQHRAPENWKKQKEAISLPRQSDLSSLQVMGSNNPPALDHSFPLPSTPAAISPGQVNGVAVRKALTRDERRLAKMALEARNSNRDLTARIKMDSAFMQFKDSEINVLRMKVESLEYENKQLKKVIEALEAGRHREETAKKRSGRESREDAAFLAKCVEEIDKLDDVSDASEPLLLGLPDDPEASKTFVPRDLGPMLGLSTGLDIRDQSGNWGKLVSCCVATRHFNTFSCQTSPSPKVLQYRNRR